MSAGLKARLVGLLALLAFNSTSQAARAEEPGPESAGSGWLASDSTAVGARVWYGLPIVLTDIASLGALVGGTLAADRGFGAGWGLILLGTGAYLFGGPIVHVTERGPALASLGLRAGAAAGGALTGAIIGGAVGSRLKCGNGDSCGLAGLAVGSGVGLLGGALLGMVVDSAALAYKSATPAPSLAVTPVYHPTNHQVGLALQGVW